MSKAKNKSNPVTALEVVTIEDRIKKFEILVKAAMEQCNVAMSLGVTGPWEGNNKIEGVLRYIDLLEVKNQNGKTETDTKTS